MSVEVQGVRFSRSEMVATIFAAEGDGRFGYFHRGADGWCPIRLLDPEGTVVTVKATPLGYVADWHGILGVGRTVEAAARNALGEK